MADGLRLIFVLVLYVLLSGITSKNVTIENKCDFTVWPGILTTNGPVSTTTTGFVLKKGEARVINASSWVAYYYVWGRRFCSTNSSGSFSCMIGDCGSGKIECSGGYYTPPVTLAQFRLGYTDGKDRHLVSVAKGYNLPMRVVPLPQGNETCSSNECIVDLNTTCPPELRVTSNTSLRQTVACMSGCQKLDMPEYCCSGPYANDKCMPTLYSQNFKSACPHASTINFEDNSYVACANTTNYVITFCPSTSLNNTKNNSSSVAVADSPSPAQTQTKSGTLEPPSESQQTDEATTGEIKKSSRKLKLVLGTISLIHVPRLCSLIAGISASLAVMIIIMGVLTVRAKNARKSDWNGENFETVVMLKRYSYARVRKMTNSFAHVLGKGGFGTVYKGKLPEGKEDVAVKILKESKENGEEFINEVASISRTSHVNIVSLLGFCYEGNKRAIIYEFMPNGSLDKFISNNMSTKMEWETLSDIAVGVSRGLEYLHNRCASRIVHFDIKPQNILMDKDLCPKISDFGLAKICKNKESIMSVLEARGTAGYIAPEVFLPNYGGVSHKSDVYSYGMVVLEMIGARSREQFEISGSNNTSMYFPDWIYRDFERGEIMRIFGDQITEEEEKIAKKMVLVGLWCIQTNPSHRPSMIKVIEMLEGSLEALQIPPKPLLCLPAAIDPETLEDSYETSNFSNPSEFERSS